VFLGEGSTVMAALGSRLRPEMPPSLAPGAGGNKLRAFNKATGAILWEMELPAGVTGAPMTYLFEGKQYVVMATGSRDGGGELVALSLP
jgi:glucose dehydrogenase